MKCLWFFTSHTHHITYIIPHTNIYLFSYTYFYSCIHAAESATVNSLLPCYLSFSNAYNKYVASIDLCVSIQKLVKPLFSLMCWLYPSVVYWSISTQINRFSTKIIYLTCHAQCSYQLFPILSYSPYSLIPSNLIMSYPLLW